MDFKNKINEGCFNAFQLGFDDYKRQVTQAFPNLNLSRIIVVEAEDRSIATQDIGVSIEQVAEVDIEDEAVIEVMAEVELIINRAVEALGVDLMMIIYLPDRSSMQCSIFF